MININDNFALLNPSYLFTEIARRVEAYRHAHPDAAIIKMGIGDVTRPIAPAAIAAMHAAVDDQADAATFHGYGPEQGYDFLREAIATYDYRNRGVDVGADEIFISDGAKSDTGAIGDILSTASRVAVTDPVYPVYVDTNVMAGRAGSLDASGRRSGLVYLPCTIENSFVPELPTEPVDIVYLCFPNNPTGTTLTRSELAQWVDWARANGALILFDSAYEAYVTEPDVPRSIFEIDGAREVAIEFRSFSKTAGFTGLRCGYTVVPRELKGRDSSGREHSLHALWNRRQCTKFNGASYIVQRGAEALFTPQGRSEVAETIAYYMRNAELLLGGVKSCGLEAAGGVNSPYIWVKTPGGMSSWEFFDMLLDRLHLVGTPGAGFGPSGEGYFRLTAFNTLENTQQAVERLKTLL